MDLSFFVAAYSIELSARKKAPVGRTMDELEDKSSYLTNIHAFLQDYFVLRRGNGAVKQSDSFEMKKIYEAPFNDTIETVFEIDYGRNGYPFSVRKGGQDIQFTKDDIIFHKYRAVFYESQKQNLAFLIIFKIGYYSCKSAILNTMRAFLNDSNVLVAVNPIAIPETLLSLGSLDDVETLECDFVERAAQNDNSADPTVKKRKGVVSSLSIDFQRRDFLGKLRSALQRVSDIFTQTSRECILTTVRASFNSDYYEIDPDSLCIVTTVNGKKRKIRLADAESALFYYDVTDKVTRANDGSVSLDSVLSVSRPYFLEVYGKWA